MHWGQLSVAAFICDFHPVCKLLRLQNAFSFLWHALVISASPLRGSPVELIELTACVPHTRGTKWQAQGEPFRRVYCLCKPPPADPLHCFFRWNPKFCLTDTLCLTLNFAQKDLVVLISEIDVLPGRWERGRRGRRPTEGCFVCLGLKDGVFPLFECLSHPPISARPAFVLFYLRHLRIIYLLTYRHHFWGNNWPIV